MVTSATVTLLFVIVVGLIPTPAPYVFITLHTELLSYQVARPTLAGVLVRDATYDGQIDCPDRVDGADRLSGLLQPVSGAAIEYRWTPGGVAITVSSGQEGPASFAFPDDQTCKFTGRTVTVVQRGDAVRDLQLPIAGKAQAGSETSVATASRAPSGTIHDGQVTVFGRTLIGRELYPVAGATYPIPPGSRLASGRNYLSPESEESGASWYGAARPGDRGLLVSATTDTTRLLLYRPGLNEQTETFSFGLLTRIFNDPSLGLLTLSLGAFFLLAGPVTGWMSLRRRTR